MDDIKDRRNPNQQDRRSVPRGGRRASDLPHPLTCPNCGKTQEVQGLSSSRVVRWCHCRACGEVWPWSVDLLEPRSL